MSVETLGGARGCLLSVVSMVNRQDVFERDLLSSLQESIDYIDLKVVRGARSGASGLNEGLDMARADVVVCAHQDVYLASGWLARLLDLLATAPKPWGVCGTAGTMRGGQMHGTHSGLGMGEPPNMMRHVEVQTLDEVVLVVRKSSGIRFDERLPYFHMYGADACLQAAERGLGVFVLDLPMQHRTSWTSGAGLLESERILREKWRSVNPIYTTVGAF